MNTIAILKQLTARNDLSAQEAEDAMRALMSGDMTHAQTASFLTALAMKGESVEEMSAFVKVMRSCALPVSVSGKALDTAGTGGSGLVRLNISTAVCFVLAALGVRVAKHGNRKFGGNCGSFDVLEALGANIELTPEQVEKTIAKTSLGFMFAPLFHPAMKHVAPVRKEIGIRTVFNVLGPLTNPAGARHQLIGVSSLSAAPKLVEVLKNLGSDHVLVVRGEDGLDEITLCGSTRVWELKNGNIAEFTIQPEDFGMNRVEFEEIKGGDVAYNKMVIEQILRGKIRDARRDMVALNSAAGLIAYDETHTFEEGIQLARVALESGQAGQKLDEYIEVSRSV
jgi:anthranilate phosphoribosyltransferase